MAKNISAQKSLPRKPRVQLEYDVHLPDGGMVNKELPWVVGVLSDLSGSNSGSLGTVEDRAWAKDITAENFDGFVKSSNVGLDFEVEDMISGKRGGKMRVQATIEQMKDFDPDRLAEIIGMAPYEIRLLEDGKGKDKQYVFDVIDPAHEYNAKFSDPVNSLDDITKEFVAAKLGIDQETFEIQKKSAQDKKRGKFHILRIEKKGPIAKLLEARGQVKELLAKMDVGNPSKIEELLGDRSFLEQFASEKGGSEAAE